MPKNKSKTKKFRKKNLDKSFLGGKSFLPPWIKYANNKSILDAV